MYKVLFTTIDKYGDCSASPSDDPNLTPLEKRLENRQLLSDDFGLQSMGHLVTPIPAPKKRSIEIVESPIWDLDLRPHAECVITQNSELGIGVFAADCIQVLLVDNEATTVGAIHLSRENLCGEFLEEAIGKVQEVAQSKALNAHLGPCLQRDNHRLGREYVNVFSQQAKGSDAHLHPVENEEAYLLDYVPYAVERLEQSGVQITEQSDVDTLDSSNHFSARGHKQFGQPRGNNLAVIRLCC